MPAVNVLGAELKILTRKQWNAAPAGKGLKSHSPNAAMIHHSGVTSKPKRALTAKMRGLQAFSQTAEKLASGKLKPAWPDVPYHFLIASDGQIAEGRDPKKMGDTNTDYDPKGYLQIAVEGDFTKEQPTADQVTATVALARKIVADYGLSNKEIYFHNEKASTACPGQYLVQALRKKIRR